MATSPLLGQFAFNGTSYNAPPPKKPISLLGSVGNTQSTTPMGVTAKTPTASVKPPPSTLPANQISPSSLNFTGQSGTVAPISTSSSKTASPASSGYIQPQSPTSPGGQVAGILNSLNNPGGTTGAGTAGAPTSPPPAGTNASQHVLTQAELDAQNAASGKSQFNTGAPTPAQMLAADPSLAAPKDSLVTSPTGANPQGTQTYSANNPVTYPGLIQQAANMASQPSAGFNDQTARANAYNDAMVRSMNEEKDQTLANSSSPYSLGFGGGREQQIQNAYLAQQNALGAGYKGSADLAGAYTTQQGTQQTGLLNAINGSAPVQVSPGNYLASPLGGGAASSAQGQAQGIQAATNWAIAQQNMSQGQNYQGISQELSNAIQTMAPIGQKLNTFITATGQNPATSPLVNEQIGKVNAQLYPAQVATLNAAVNDIRSYAVQILGSQSGANPTDVTSAVNSFDFSKFSAADLSSFLGDLNNLGNTRLSQAQSAMHASYGANNTVGTPAAGMTAQDQGAFNTGSMTPSSMGSNIGKALVGTIASSAGAAVHAASGAISSATGGAIGGAAAELFLP